MLQSQDSIESVDSKILKSENNRADFNKNIESKSDISIQKQGGKISDFEELDYSKEVSEILNSNDATNIESNKDSKNIESKSTTNKKLPNKPNIDITRTLNTESTKENKAIKKQVKEILKDSKTDSNIESKNEDEAQDITQMRQQNQKMEIYLKRRNDAIKDMNYVHERELMHTIKPEKLDSKTLQEGASSAKTQKEVESAHQKANFDDFKTHLFLGLHGGVTFSAVASNTHALPTINIKVGFQNFFGASAMQLGVRVYADNYVASNILLSLQNDPLTDFIDTTFTATNMNAELVFEVNVSKRIRFGLGAGFGVGYMTYHDEFWDTLNGFATNAGVITYLTLNNRNKIELGYKLFFYSYGDYITRKLENVVEKPYNLLNSDFAKPMVLSAGWVYVF